MRFAMSGGVSAAPSDNPMVCSPCTEAQLRGGNHTSNTPAETGNVAPWEQPNSSCAESSATNSETPVSQYGASGVATVARNAASPMMTKVRRAPWRCPKCRRGLGTARTQNERPLDQTDLKLAETEIRHHALGGHCDAFLL